MKVPSKQWQFKDFDGDVRALAKTLGVSALTARLLAGRGIDTSQAAEAFLNPSIEQLHDPFELTGMKDAVEGLRRALDEHERVCVWGDFDVDGITSTVLLVTVLRDLGFEVDHHVPDRMREGYGLNRGTIARIAKKCSLMVTVDCGIAAPDEVAFARERGMDVIVTDHHEPGELLPEAAALIDPKRADCGYGFKELAGVGVAYKLAQALAVELGRELPECLDLVTLGTVADVVPLLGENRVLVAKGLPKLLASERPGIRALLEVTGLAEKEELGSGQVGFVIGPRINASGRIASASEAVELMLTDDKSRALSIARRIDEKNRERQRVEDQILTEALAMVETSFDPERDKSIVLVSESWHEGVKGIVASRLAEMFCRPTFLFSVRDGLARGSARSIQGLNLHAVLQKMSELFTRFGGHAAAAGMSLPVERMDEFRQLLAAELEQVLAPEDLVPKQRIDARVDSADVNHDLAGELKRLAPFGMGNPSPVLAMTDVYLEGQQRVGAGGDHLKFRVRGQERAHEAIAFRLGDIATVERHFGRADVAFQLEADRWRGAERLQLRVIDLRLGDVSCSDAQDADEPCDPLIERLFTEAEQLISDEDYKHIGDADAFYTKVVGVTFEGRQDVLVDLAADEPARLQREPENEHDPNAIRVTDKRGRQVGYLAAALAKHLAPEMDKGTAYEAAITDVTGGDEKHFGVNLLVRKALGEAEREAADRQAAREEWQSLPEGELIDHLADEFLGGGTLTDRQREALDALAAGENTLVVMGTGRGKSLIFHAHAARLALREGRVSIFVYPLRALISDQQVHLDEVFAPVGLRAVTLNGDTALSARDDAFAGAAAGETDVILTTPEFLHHHIARFAELGDKVGFLVIDEAHHICTSSSGHRPLYKRLDETAATLGSPLVLAVTATADDETAAEVCRSLAIGRRIIDRSVRDNLRVVDEREGKGKDNHVIRLAARDEKTIVYVNSREQSVRLAERVRREIGDRLGAVVYYNAGLGKEMRKAIEVRFRSGETRVVIATSAFGEGINIPDVRNVVLYHMPLSAIEYNQQSGRVGRDGGDGLIHLLFGPDDLRLNRRLLESYSPSREALVELYKLVRELTAGLGEAATGREDAGGGAEGEDLRPGFSATNDEMAEMLAKRRTKTSISARGASSGLRIFEELGLVRLEGSNRWRRIILQPAPEGKLDLTDSVRFQEGADEKDAFDEFGTWALTSDAEALLAAVNRPICPSAGVDEAVRAAFGDVTPVQASADSGRT